VCHGNCRTQLAAAHGIPPGIRTNQSFGAEFSQRCMSSTPKPAAATWEREMEWNGKVRGTHVPRDHAYLHFYPSWRGIPSGMGLLKIRVSYFFISHRKRECHVLFQDGSLLTEEFDILLFDYFYVKRNVWFMNFWISGNQDVGSWWNVRVPIFYRLCHERYLQTLPAPRDMKPYS